MDRKNLEFASLLHDIGKFYQRTGSSHDNKFWCKIAKGVLLKQEF